jgi:hypothetical protein
MSEIATKAERMEGIKKEKTKTGKGEGDWGGGSK